MMPTRFAMPVPLPRDGRERAGPDDLTRAPREIEVVLDVVRAREAVVEELLGVEEVREVGAAVARAALAGAALLDGRRVVAEARVADVELAALDEEVAVARVARRHYAVEHVDARADGRPDVGGRAHAHEVARATLRHVGRDRRDDVVHDLGRLADAEPAQRQPVERVPTLLHRGELAEVAAPQVEVRAS